MNRSAGRHRVHRIERSYRLSARSRSMITAVGAIASACFGAVGRRLPQLELVNSARIPFKEQRRVNRPHHQQSLKRGKEEVRPFRLDTLLATGGVTGESRTPVSVPQQRVRAASRSSFRSFSARMPTMRRCFSWCAGQRGGAFLRAIWRSHIKFGNYKAQSKLQDDLQISAWIGVTQRSG